MKVCFLTTDVTRSAGGLYFSVRALAQNLSREANVNIEVWSLKPTSNHHDTKEWSPIKLRLFPVNFIKSYGFSSKMIYHFITAKFDIIHLHGLWSMPTIIAIIALLRGIPVVISPRGMLDPWILEKHNSSKKLFAKLVDLQLVRRSSLIHCLAENEKLAVKLLPFECKCAVIPNGIEQQQFEFTPTNHAIKSICYIGRYDDKKGLLEFIIAWSKIDKKIKEQWRLDFYGWGSENYKDKMKLITTELCLEKEISVNGPVYSTEKSNILKKSFAFVLPTKSEGLPMAILEAWSYGLPVLTTKHANLPIGFSRGASHDLGDFDTSTQGLEDFLSLKNEEFSKMSSNALKLVEQEFSWKSIAQSMNLAYVNILDSKI